MILTVKIEIDKNKENYQAVLKALEEFDIASASWEDDKAPAVKVDQSARMDKNVDPAGALSQAIDRVRRNGL